MITIALLGACWLCAACERPAVPDMEIPKPELVLSSTFSVGQPFKVSVTSTRAALPATPVTYVRDAEVTLWQGDTPLERLKRVEETFQSISYYTSTEYRAQPNTRYTIKVSAPGFEPVIAQSIIPTPVPLERTRTTFAGYAPSQNLEELLCTFNFEVVFNDPAQHRNYYHLRIHQEVQEFKLSESGDTVLTGRSLQHLGFGASINNNAVTAYLEDGVLLDDIWFNGRTLTLPLSVQMRIRAGREIPCGFYVELRTVSEEYYKFHSSIARNKNNPGPPYTEPVIVYSNVQRGRGVFAGFSAAMDSIRVVW